MEISKPIDEPSPEMITIPKSAEMVERCESMIPKSAAEVEMKPTRFPLNGRSRPRFRSQDPANAMRRQYSSLLDLFEKETYKHKENRNDRYLNDDEYVSDYDDDAVVVPEGVDPVLYKRRRKHVVAIDKRLQKLKCKTREIVAPRKEERERALLDNQEKGGSTGVHQVVAI